MTETYRSGLAVPIGRSASVEIPVRVVRVLLTGFLFDTNKCFVLPGAMKGIRRLKEIYEEHSKPQVLVVGHTDTVDTPQSNQILSEERAVAIADYLTDNVDGWLPWYGAGKPGGKRWGATEDHHMLSALPEGEVPFTAQDQPVLAFQRWHNQKHGTSLAEDGFAGPETRRALITRYMALDGTTLPAGAVLQTHGCGESHNAVDRGDEVEEQQNRRVEVFMFAGAITPPPRKPCPPPPGCPEYPKWLEQVLETIDVNHDPPPPVDEPIDITMLTQSASAEAVVREGDAETKRIPGIDEGEGKRRFRVEGIPPESTYRVEVVDPEAGVLAAWMLKPGEFHRAMKSGDVDQINAAFRIADR